VDSFEGLIDLAQTKLLEGLLAQIGDKILIIGGVPTKKAKGTNFLKIHTIAD
jgi:pyruvate kinase